MAHPKKKEWLGAYYVVNFTAYGGSFPSLPNTQGDVFGWINGADPNQNQVENFADGDGTILAADFTPGTDDDTDVNLGAGVRGIDSVIAAYISTHGNRSKTQYGFLIGVDPTTKNPGSVLNTDMSLGDGSLRYLFLATCDSVPLSDPGSVWWAAANGLRAVFGYDASIADSPSYGAFFFQELLKNPGNTMTQAFLDASWRVSHYQAPVAAWFGATQKAADAAREGESQFQDNKITNAKFMSWKYYAAKPIPSSLGPFVVRGGPLNFADPSPLTNAAALMEPFVPDPADLQPPLKAGHHGNSRSFVTRGGTHLVWHKLSGSIDITFPSFKTPSVFERSDEDAIAKATEYLHVIHDAIPGARTSAPGFDLGFTAAALRRTLTATSDREQATAAVVSQLTVIFRQTVNGVPTIGTGGVVEVTLNGQLEVTRVRMVVRALATNMPHGPPVAPPIDVQALKSKAEERALAELQTASNSCEIAESEFGYYAADESVQQHTSEPSFRVVVKVTSAEILIGGVRSRPGSDGTPVASRFTRLFERIYKTSELDLPIASRMEPGSTVSPPS